MDEEVKNAKVETVEEVKKTEVEAEIIKEEVKPGIFKKGLKGLDLVVRWLLTVIESLVALFVGGSVYSGWSTSFSGLVIMAAIIGSILIIIPLRDKKFDPKTFNLTGRYVVFFILAFTSFYFYLTTSLFD